MKAWKRKFHTRKRSANTDVKHRVGFAVFPHKCGAQFLQFVRNDVTTWRAVQAGRMLLYQREYALRDGELITYERR